MSIIGKWKEQLACIPNSQDFLPNSLQIRESQVHKSIDLSICSENTAKKLSLFVGVIQTYSDKTVTILKANATVGYPVHIVLLNYAKDLQRFLVDHGQTMIGLLPVSVSHFAAKTRDKDIAEACDGKMWRDCHSTYPRPFSNWKGHGKEMKIKILHTSIQLFLIH